MKRKLLATLIGITITIILVSLLLSQIQMDDIVSTLTTINTLYILFGFILYIIINFFRTLRFYILLDRKIAIRNLFNIVCVHNMVNNILPARTGELSYIYLLKKHYNTKIGDGIATLFVARIFDFIAIFLMFFIAFILTKDLPILVTKVVWYIVFLFIICIVLLVGLLFFGKSVLKLAIIFSNKMGLKETRIVKYLLGKGRETMESFEEIKSKKLIFSLLLCSILIIGFSYLLIYIILYGMNIFLPFQKVLLGSTFLLLSTVLPIYGIGGFGTTEGFWALVFVPLGLTLETAIISGFSYHIIILIYLLVTGGYGLLIIYLSHKQTS
ncbi:MAG: dolichol-P-glucose synthetase [Candidatus Methanoperedens nitroreducens]|uniref:Dolichol-P-glucose synthetase n=1 Tax=Candidatus Methanoperedens nitratireducens TaxID=1392998 RepID=A0A0P8A8T0_9EURY|nr:lysylphosphatidylglycerol synthase transmembrane domain-containing protein [Candidatus Methanoperedens sp. BLZ2]KAB2945328.1 MAG: flippase-like domain-containing protein [Candidatus Methanoperedens sp.]KPQ43019.1 MAG: dolichol-P-glucose synthetase [Candidatus Methanoperedens sp. BLZ1]MBZ0176564.1 flippase-like domain-containing protein [Candidatus Methanoperedens nitroreducens]MCX9077881.1 lysylphosphatidylglycerol synthase transmembrane domain-containing protein [Candidatus Methanoperedens 